MAPTVKLPPNRGARRRKVGRSGRLHLDRRLPFLVVHRLRAGETASRSLARRIALNSPGYLVWEEGDDDHEALELLNILAIELGEPGMPLLVIAVDDLDQAPESDASQHLTPFVAVVSGGRSSREKRAREALIKALGKIEIDLRHPKVFERPVGPGHWLVEALSDETAISDPLLVSLPQIHRRNDGGVYPQLAHELSVACGDALLRTACAYLDDARGHAPAHYRSLGRSAFLKAALNADEKLARISGSFDFLLAVSPINTTEALEQFIAHSGETPPEFRYRPLTVDPDAVKRRLYRLDFSRLEDPLLERLFTAKRHEIDAQLTMLATRNTPSFRPASLFLYGTVSPALLRDAKQVLALPNPRVPCGRRVDAPAIAEAARQLIGSYSHKGASFDAEVELRDDVSGLMVTRNKLLVGSATSMPAARLDALLSHEVSTHLLTYLNGAAQGLSIFRSGLAKYEGIQEGLGVFAEWAVGGLSMTRMRLLAARVVAVAAMQNGAEFMDTYRLLRERHGYSLGGAFSIATRVHRSGGLAKDAIYLDGFRAVIDYVTTGGSLAPFWLGKIALTDVPAIEELLQRRLVHAPKYLPEYLERPDAIQRIARLNAGIALEQLLGIKAD
ncbi:flavohemoglobin expression-modulating QEGLA motif protein [Sphingomonas sp. GCM10030256]|uniref:flavohemoglobin expression-modulating QEGLA motif protein n=1 Tax=Sphingomonas sp. GCM10030256 TaxID=3273427 RepID=UPI0036063729